MFESLTKEESFKAIDDKVKEQKNILNQVDTLSEEEIRQSLTQLSNDIKELWYHIYDLDGKEYIRE